MCSRPESDYGDTGLDLAPCRHIYPMMGGDLSVESVYTKGRTTDGTRTVTVKPLV